jgi:hypothetical protein
MKALLGVILVVVAGVCNAAEAYKWVDENGITNYGEKPPEDSRAARVDTQPSGIIETGGEIARPRAAETPQRLQERPVQVIPVPVQPSYARAAPVRGMAFDTFIRLERGMTEGELLVRAGRPDHDSVESVWDYPIRTFYYFPTVADPYTTVVRLRGGRIAHIERVKKF